MSKSSGGLGGNGPDFAKGFSLAFEFAGAVLLFWLVGRFVDNWFDIEPWGQVVGAVIGWVGGFLHVFYRTKGIGWETVPGTRRPAPEPAPKERSAWGKKRDAGNGVAEHGTGEAAGVAEHDASNGVAEHESGAAGVAEDAREAGGVAEDGARVAGGVAEIGASEAGGVEDGAAGATGVAEGGADGASGVAEDGAGEVAERETSGVVEAYLAAVARDEGKSRVKGDTQ